MAALRRIIQGHLQRFQLADRQRAQQWQQGRVDMQLQPYRKQQPAGAPTHLSFEFAVPPNTPTPKNYAMNFLPEGKDVAPGTSYIPLKLLRIRRWINMIKRARPKQRARERERRRHRLLFKWAEAMEVGMPFSKSSR